MQILISVGVWEPTPYGYREMIVPSCEALGEPKKSGVGGGGCLARFALETGQE